MKIIVLQNVKLFTGQQCRDTDTENRLMVMARVGEAGRGGFKIKTVFYISVSSVYSDVKIICIGFK